MLNWLRNISASNVFNWKRQGVQDVSPDIEMTDYRRIPNTYSENPSGLVNDESINVQPIADLDFFFERIYSYYCEKGLWCIILRWIAELLSLGFIICFSGFIFLYVDWNGLRNAKCGMAAVESGREPCDLAKEAIHQHPLIPLTVHRAIIVGYLGVFFVYWIFCLLKFFLQLKDTLKIHLFYYNSLCVTDHEIQTMSWPTILEKIVHLQKSQQLCVVKNLSAHDIVMRLMRKENYLIAMINKGVLTFPISKWVPGAGSTVKYGTDGTQYRLILPRTLELALDWCILQSMFDRNFCVRMSFVSDSKTLKRRLMVVGIAMLVLSPFLIMFMLSHLFLRYAEQIYNQPSTISSRRWSNLSRWVFREFNEVDHLFKHRTNSGVSHASIYMKQFPSPMISIIEKFISFVSGGFVAILIILAFLEESLLEGHILGRNLLWYAAIFGAITALKRVAFTENEVLVTDPEGAMSMVVDHTHYMPKRWRGKESTEMVRHEFKTLFQYSGMMLLEEMASIFVTPFLLLFVVPERADDILQFIENFTVYVEGVGDVCSFSVFNFQEYGNKSYGSPSNVPRSQRSSQGKLEKSFLSFHNSYPFWEPNNEGKQFLQNLRRFRDKKLAEHVKRHGFVPIRPWRDDNNMGRNGDKNSFTSKEMSHGTFVTGNHLGSLLVTESSNRNNHPYLLDWYYISQPRYATPGHVSTNRFEATKHHSHSILEENEHEYYQHMNEFCNERGASYLGASTSSFIFRESLIEDSHSIDVSRTTKSRWWDRSQPRNEDSHKSFLEPPDFNDQRTHNYHDRFSDRGSEDQGQEHLCQGQHDHTSFSEPQDFYHQTTYNFHDKFSDEGQYLYGGDYHELPSMAEADNLDAGKLNLRFGESTPKSPTVNPSLHAAF
ncbi:Autophagy-related protein 9 [Vigna unguiculata]|uniref:Autophagy-related protein 9 n=1 Tax=Vigna unguiculata TaxID=3917 RepID=A0A4D6MZD9_VIGUN|nr:Autophagy-related protein 9 [Vigna unguiculata]